MSREGGNIYSVLKRFQYSSCRRSVRSDVWVCFIKKGLKLSGIEPPMTTVAREINHFLKRYFYEKVVYVVADDVISDKFVLCGMPERCDYSYHLQH